MQIMASVEADSDSASDSDDAEDEEMDEEDYDYEAVKDLVEGEIPLARGGTEESEGGDLGGGRHKFCGTITVDRSGPFGYTVRVLPTHPELADKAELGLVANA